MTRGVGFIMISRCADGVVSVIFSILIARMLTPDSYGLLSTTMGIAGLVTLVFTLGTSYSVTKFISSHLAAGDGDKIRTTISATLSLQFVLAIISGIVCFFISEPLAKNVFCKPELLFPLRIVSVFIVISALSNWILALFQGFHRMEFIAAADVVGIIARLIIAVALVWKGYGVAGAVIGFIIGSAVTAAVGTLLSVSSIYPAIPKRQNKTRISPEIRDSLKYGIPMMTSAAIVLLYEVFSIFMLTAFRTINEVSWYTIAFGIINMIMIIPVAMGTSLLPITSGLHAKKDMSGISVVYRTTLKLLTYATNFVVFVFIATAAPLILIMFGESYLPAVIPFLILAAIGFIRPASILSESVSAGMGMPMINTKANLVTACLVIIFNIMLVPTFGIIGAAVATSAAYSCGMCYLIYSVNRLSGTAFPFAYYLKSLSAGAASAILIFLMIKLLISLDFSFLPFAGTVSLLLSVSASCLAGACIYLVLLSLMSGFSKHDFQLLSELRVPFGKTICRIMGKISRLRD